MGPRLGSRGGVVCWLGLLLPVDGRVPLATDRLYVARGTGLVILLGNVLALQQKTLPAGFHQRVENNVELLNRISPSAAATASMTLNEAARRGCSMSFISSRTRALLAVSMSWRGVPDFR
jgi:hypothetical protein